VDEPLAVFGMRLLKTMRSVVNFVVVSTASPAGPVVLDVTISVDEVMIFWVLGLRLKRFEKVMFAGIGMVLGSRSWW
jgi:hypothetical protein